MSIELRLQLNLHCWLIPSGHVRYEYWTCPVYVHNNPNQGLTLNLISNSIQILTMAFRPPMQHLDQMNIQMRH